VLNRRKKRVAISSLDKLIGTHLDKNLIISAYGPFATPLTQIHATDLAPGEAPPSPEGSAHFAHPISH
jgi:hypothetical protein